MAPWRPTTEPWSCAPAEQKAIAAEVPVIKALVVLGTRPEAIKLAPVIRELKRRAEFEPVVCVTSQHRQMQDQVLELFDIRPDHDLDVMEADQNLHDLTARLLARLRGVLEGEQPDVVLVQGDTTTAFSGALAAYYAQVPIAHVEAGLRTGDKYNPFPEEANRAFIDVIADFCFAPTQTSAQHLLDAGVAGGRIFVTGNTAIDALLYVSRWLASLQGDPDQLGRVLSEVPLALRESIERADTRLVLVTGHRRESLGTDLANVCRALREITAANPDVQVVFPVHLNPHVRESVYSVLEGAERVHLLEPLGYGAFVWLMMHSHLVITDSGGIQEESPSLGVPVLVTRKVTERPEGVAAGTAALVGVATRPIVEAVNRLLHDDDAYRSMAAARNPYGDGTAAEQMAATLERRLGARAG